MKQWEFAWAVESAAQRLDPTFFMRGWAGLPGQVLSMEGLGIAGACIEAFEFSEQCQLVFELHVLHVFKNMYCILPKIFFQTETR